jgi:hypothetical protein
MKDEKEKEKSNIPEESKVDNKNSNANNLNDMKLVCPQCGLIPAIFHDIKAKNIYQISAGCENKHLINNMPIKAYYEKCMKLKDSPKDTLNDFICIKHNANYNSFCKTCRKNICKECYDTEHRNHFISQFYELLLSNEEIIQLKNSIDNEISDVNNFLIETFNKWKKELELKFNELIENLQAKNKLYNFIINFYETKEFNYQNIYNIKIVAQNQLQRNPLTQEIQTLKNIITKNESLLKIHKNKEDYEDSKEKYFRLKSAQLLKIINILNEDINSNYKFTSYESHDQSLESFLEDKRDITSSTLSDYVIVNPYNKTKSILEMSCNDNLNSNNKDMKEDDKQKMNKSLTLNERMEFANEIKLKKRKMNQKLEQGSIVHCLTVLKDYKGNLVNKFAAGLENGNINVYYVDPKSNNIFLDFEIKEHTKAVTHILCLHDGRLLTCSQDNTMKVIEETISYSYLLSFWRRYYLIQTLTKPNIDKYNIFQPISVIEMSYNTIISGDWKNITIWKLIRKEQKKHKKREKINYSFDLLDYNRYKYNYYYEIYKEIEVSTSVTALLNIDGQNYVSAHYGPGIVSFYNLQNDTIKSVDKIKCVDSSTYCLTLIEIQKPENDWQKDKIIVVGGYKCIYLLSVKEQNLIDKISLPGNDYVRSIMNSGISKISNGFICGGLFNQCSYDLVHYNTKKHLGFSEIVINEISRIEEAGKGPINSIIIVKKNNNDKSYDQKNLVLITASNDQSIKSYIEADDDDEE